MKKQYVDIDDLRKAAWHLGEFAKSKYHEGGREALERWDAARLKWNVLELLDTGMSSDTPKAEKD